MIKSTSVVELLTDGVGSNASGYEDNFHVEVMFDDGPGFLLNAETLANAAVLHLQQWGEVLSLESTKIAERSDSGASILQVTFDDGTTVALNEEELKLAATAAFRRLSEEVDE